MNDQDETDIDAIEALPAPPHDAFAALENLLQLVADPKAFKSWLRGLHQALAAVTEGQAKLAAERKAFVEESAQERAALAVERADVEKRRTAVNAAEGLLTMRERCIADLEGQWKFVSETDPLVLSGMRAPEYGTALQKARRAAGIDPPLDDDEPTVERRLSREADDGTPFPPDTTIVADVAVRTRPARPQRVRADQ
jgi:hypothetical protein